MATGIRIGIIDTPLDLSDPFPPSANRTALVGRIRGIVPGTGPKSRALFSPALSAFRGIAPGCGGFSIPIFECGPGPIVPAHQRQLAQAIRDAVAAGVDILNVSAGQLVADATVAPSLVRPFEIASRTAC